MWDWSRRAVNVLKSITNSNSKPITLLALFVVAIFCAVSLVNFGLSRSRTVTPEKDIAASLTSTTVTTIIASMVLEPPNKPPLSSFSLSAVGDINTGSRPASYVKEFGYPYKNIRDILTSSDLAFGNLECALSVRGKPIPNKEFTFRGSPEDARYLRGTGFNVFSIANNHSKDYGEEAFLDTLEFLKKAQIVQSGGGKNLSEAYRPGIIEAGGEKVAFLSFSDVLPGGFAATSSSCGVASIRDRKMVFSSIEEAKKEANFIVISIHWGKELSTSPSRQHVELAHQLIDQGADLILGHHPHVVQGFEVYKGKLIAYSLGNFMFAPGNSKGRQSVLLTARIEDDNITDARIYPVYIDGIRPKLTSGKQGRDWLNEVAARSRGFKTPLKQEASDNHLYLRILF